MKKIALFTSGGDSPGMNACIRAIVRSACQKGLQVNGIMRGYQGMIDNDFIELNPSSVSHILDKGGTILKTARCKDFFTKEGREIAFNNLKSNEIDGVIAIGGDGTFTGAKIFNQEHQIPFIGIPGTIDNDLFGTDNTIGYDTAINTVMEAVDKIRDTATSHNRLFFVEVMGKDAGFIALRSGIAVGAEAVLIPETPTYIDKLVDKLEKGRRTNKTGGIIIVSEGDDLGGAFEVSKKVKAKFPHFETKVTVLGHIQRGGSPTARDRVLASTLGYHAVKALLDESKTNIMIGEVNRKITYTSFDEAIKHNQKLNTSLIDLVDALSY